MALLAIAYAVRAGTCGGGGPSRQSASLRNGAGKPGAKALQARAGGVAEAPFDRRGGHFVLASQHALGLQFRLGGQSRLRPMTRCRNPSQQPGRRGESDTGGFSVTVGVDQERREVPGPTGVEAGSPIREAVPSPSPVLRAVVPTGTVIRSPASFVRQTAHGPVRRAGPTKIDN